MLKSASYIRGKILLNLNFSKVFVISLPKRATSFFPTVDYSWRGQSLPSSFSHRPTSPHALNDSNLSVAPKYHWHEAHVHPRLLLKVKDKTVRRLYYLSITVPYITLKLSSLKQTINIYYSTQFLWVRPWGNCLTGWFWLGISHESRCWPELESSEGLSDWGICFQMAHSHSCWDEPSLRLLHRPPDMATYLPQSKQVIQESEKEVARSLTA